MEKYIELIKQIPVSKRLELLPIFLKGLSLEGVYIKVDSLEYYKVPTNGNRIIMGEKPVVRKVHYKYKCNKYQFLCKVDGGRPLSMRFKATEVIADVTCENCKRRIKSYGLAEVTNAGV